MTYKSPFIVREHIGIPGGKVSWVAINDETGITTGGYNSREIAAEHAKALSAAYELGRNHESHDAGRIVQAARKVHECRQDDACNDAPHSCHVDLNAAIELADAIEQYDTYHENRSPMLLDHEPRRLTDDELGGEAKARDGKGG